MACVFPIDAWYSKRLNESGKRGVVFNIRDGFADRPLQLPCGKCVGCAADRSLVWAVRMHHESTQHERNSFVTLTYGATCPDSICRRDLQLFFKRLRRNYKVRYFACGEYGTLNHRPHYHAVIFGEDFLGGAFKINDQLHGNPYFDRAWPHGFSSIGSVSMASCMYVAGYVNKKLADRDTFNLMSRRPGIGHTWLEKYSDDIRRTETVAINGQEFPIPKKYLEWKQQDFSQLIKDRKAYFNSLTPDQRYHRATQLAAREELYKSREKLKVKKL